MYWWCYTSLKQKLQYYPKFDAIYEFKERTLLVLWHFWATWLCCGACGWQNILNRRCVKFRSTIKGLSLIWSWHLWNTELILLADSLVALLLHRAYFSLVLGTLGRQTYSTQLTWRNVLYRIILCWLCVTSNSRDLPRCYCGTFITQNYPIGIVALWMVELTLLVLRHLWIIEFTLLVLWYF